MKVLPTLYGEERAAQEFSPEEGAAEMAAWQAFGEAAQEAGVLIACEGLCLVTDGDDDPGPGRSAPGHRLGRSWRPRSSSAASIFLEVRDLDEAIAWSERTPWNKDGCHTEIRPIIDYQAWEAEAAGAQQTAS